jgi:hypothetical protein
MKPISELRTTLSFFPQEINSSVRYFSEKVIIDYDVFLPSRKINLQRDFVWNLAQKRELIWSILMKRHIPRMAMINTIENVYQVIDGKQRLSTMIDFYNNKFNLLIEDEFYLFKDLPEDYKNAIIGYHFSYYIVNEEYSRQITDNEKIDWFKFINFAGTPQDTLHFKKIK